MNRSGDGDKSERRFIAGAVCPACGEMDRIVLERSDSAEPRRRCVACGFVDAGGPGAAHVPPTRHSRTSQAANEVAIAPVRLLEQDPEAASKTTPKEIRKAIRKEKS